MNFSKKLLSIFAVIGLVFAGCGSDDKGGETTDGKKTITVAVEADSFVEYMTEAGKAFEEETGIAVKIEQTGMFDVIDALPTQQGNAADVFFIPNDRIGSLASQKLIADLDLDLSNHIDNAQGAVKYDGKTYMLPMSAETTLLIRNTEMLPEVPTSLKSIGNDKFLAKFTDFYYTAGMFFDKGAYIFGSDSSDIGLATDEAVAAGKDIQSLYQSGDANWTLMQDDTVSHDIMMEQFTTGKVAAVINGPWVISDIEKSGIPFEVSPIPSFDGEGKYQALTGMKGVAVNAYSSEKEAAKQFVEFLNTGEFANTWHKTTSEVSPHTAVTYEEGSIAQQVFNAVELGYVMPTDPDFGYVWAPMADALKQIAAGSDVKESLEAAVKTIENEIAAN